MDCEKMSKGTCNGCNVVSIIWEKAANRQSVASVAKRVSKKYCPNGEGSIDPRTIGTIYNYKADADQNDKSSIW
jgi:hypothetical protein